MKREAIAKMCDHTLLKAFAQKGQIEKLCEEAREYHTASVCVNPCYIETAKKLLEGSGVAVCTVIGFPLGANTPETKAFETKDAIAKGADEVIWSSTWELSRMGIWTMSMRISRRWWTRRQAR